MKKILPIIIALVVIGGGAFYSGIKYQQSKSSLSGFARQNFQNLSEEERQQISQRRIGMRQEAGFLSGEVIVKDEQSLTLKMSDGSSRIIFFSDSTEISKMSEGTIDDIEIGKQITITGQQNPDGSYTANTIQLTPRLVPR